MYFPYLRGRQFELIALRELLEKKLISDRIIPVIEPLKPTSTLAKTLKAFSENEHFHALIMNPEVGEFVSKIREKTREDRAVNDIYADLESKYLVQAYLMKKSTPKQLAKKEDIKEYMIINPKRDCLEDFMKVYSDFEPRYTLLPDDRTFSRKAPDSKVLFMDRFPRAARNKDYSINIDEFFSEDHLYYRSDGFKGFSDYSIAGAEYMESGFAPLAVAIHIVYFDSEKILRIHHFVSDSNDDINDPAGKFGEAVAKLHKWVDAVKPHMTNGLETFLEYNRSGKYPGLGTVKKLSIMHHIELVNKFLEGEI